MCGSTMLDPIQSPSRVAFVSAIRPGLSLGSMIQLMATYSKTSLLERRRESWIGHWCIGGDCNEVIEPGDRMNEVG